MKLTAYYVLIFLQLTTSIDAIVNGQPVLPGLYSFMTALLNQSNNKQFCSGTLISPYYVLTAGHCLVRYSIDNLQVKVHRTNLNLNDFDEGGINFEVDKIVIHPKFRATERGISNDIGLIKLNQPVPGAKPDKYHLPQPSNHYYHQFYYPTININPKQLDTPSQKLIILGWGNILNSGPASPHLLKANISKMEEFYCFKKLNQVYDIDFKTTFCGGDISGTFDACQGDSGGPVLVLDEGRNILVQVGIISYGYQCGRVDTPALYTKLSEYANWISSITNIKINF